jgi:hypothetical protein
MFCVANSQGISDRALPRSNKSTQQRRNSIRTGLPGGGVFSDNKRNSIFSSSS